MKTLGLCPKPRKGTRPLDPFTKKIFFFSRLRRAKKRVFSKRGAGELAPLLGFLARAELKVLIKQGGNLYPA
jgi:hypothetical protein